MCSYQILQSLGALNFRFWIFWSPSWMWHASRADSSWCLSLITISTLCSGTSVWHLFYGIKHRITKLASKAFNSNINQQNVPLSSQVMSQAKWLINWSNKHLSGKSNHKVISWFSLMRCVITWTASANTHNWLWSQNPIQFTRKPLFRIWCRYSTLTFISIFLQG